MYIITGPKAEKHSRRKREHRKKERKKKNKEAELGVIWSFV